MTHHIVMATDIRGLLTPLNSRHFFLVRVFFLLECFVFGWAIVPLLNVLFVENTLDIAGLVLQWGPVRDTFVLSYADKELLPVTSGTARARARSRH